MEQDLIRACQRGDLLQVQELCKMVDGRHVQSGLGMTLLHIAAK